MNLTIVEVLPFISAPLLGGCLYLWGFLRGSWEQGDICYQKLSILVIMGFFSSLFVGVLLSSIYKNLEGETLKGAVTFFGCALVGTVLIYSPKIYAEGKKSV